MKRSPIQRKTRLERSARLQGGSQLKRVTPLRARSKKQEALYRIRRPLVAELLAEQPVCERCQSARSTDVHEPRMRSRGADITDREQCVCLCRDCHSWVHAHPTEATAEGWLIPSWAYREAS
jgi:hypothetical protein